MKLLKKEIDKNIADFLTYCIDVREFSENTIISYRTDLVQFNKFLEGNILKATATDIGQWVKDFGSATKSRKIASLKTFFDWASGVSKLVSENVAKNMISPKIPVRQMNFVRKDEYLSVEKTLDDRNYRYNNRDKMMFDIMYNCGLRVSEVVSLNADLFNFVNNTFYVIGKGNKERKCYMNKTVVESIKTWLEDREKILASDGRISKALLITKTSERISIRGAQKIVESLAKTNAHAFRHGFCSELASKGVNLAYIATAAGHASTNTTRRYVHTNDEAMADMVALLNA